MGIDKYVKIADGVLNATREVVRILKRERRETVCVFLAVALFWRFHTYCLRQSPGFWTNQSVM